MTSDQREQLIQAACESRAQAYAPYSHYAVGAAVLGEDGRIYTGVNVENAVYPLGICAERAAVFSMVSEGVRRLQAVAVCTANGGPPCGSCRQVLVEFAGDVPIYMSDEHGRVRETTLHTLLPDHFGPEYLPETGADRD